MERGDQHHHRTLKPHADDPEGARALLFERLEDRGLAEARPFRVHDRDGLRESVAREVSRLLNTRCGLRSADLAGRERTVLEYGLPDWSPTHARDADACATLEVEAARAIAAYEPRLRDARVKATPVVGRERELRLTISATLVGGGVAEPVSFPVMLGE